MSSCALKSCKNYNRCKLNDSQGITYHAFPRNVHFKNYWVRIIRQNRGDEFWNPSPSSTLCSAHFDHYDFRTTKKGLRLLVPSAVPKRLLSNTPEAETQGKTPSLQLLSNSPKAETQEKSSSLQSLSNAPKAEIQEESSSLQLLSNTPEAETQEKSSSPQIASYDRGTPPDQQTSSPPSTTLSVLQVPDLINKLASSAYCRLCANLTCHDQLLNVQSDDTLKTLVLNMTNKLNVNIDFDHNRLSTTICCTCVQKLYMSYDFVVGIGLAQETLIKMCMQDNQYQIPENNLCNTSSKKDSSNIGTEETNFKQSLQFVPNLAPPPDQSQSPNTTMIKSVQPILPELSSTRISFYDSPRKPVSKDILTKKSQVIDKQKRKIKTLSQKLRRTERRFVTLKKVFINMKKRNFIGTDIFGTLNENVIAVDLFNNINRKKHKKPMKFSQAFKKFSLTLNSCSPMAYDYVRMTFDACLPHSKTLARWQCLMKGEGGINKEKRQTLCACRESRASESVS